MSFISNFRRKFWLVSIALIVFVVLFFAFFGKFFERTVNVVGAFFYSHTQSLFWDMYLASDPENLKKENSALQEELTQLRERVNTIEAIKLENDHLKKLVEYRETVSFTARTARVVGMERELNSRSVVIDQGASDGIQVGYMVTNEHGELLGKVISTEKNHAHVRLITHPQLLLAVKKTGTNEALGVAQGNFSLTLKLDLIPEEVAIAKGDIMVTASLNGQPENIIVGTVVSVSDSHGGLFKEAGITPAFDIHNLMFVNVIMPMFDDQAP